MQFLALLRRDLERFSDADFTPHLPGEAQQRRQLYVDAALRQVWNRGDLPGSVMIFEAADQAAAKAHLQTLPLISTGMMLADALVPLQPYPGFGPR